MKWLYVPKRQGHEWSDYVPKHQGHQWSDYMSPNAKDTSEVTVPKRQGHQWSDYVSKRQWHQWSDNVPNAKDTNEMTMSPDAKDVREAAVYFRNKAITLQPLRASSMATFSYSVWLYFSV